ncbi:ATP-binding cassette domain-containing protein [Microbispora sp. RL4-1S]|uniref:ATP-binding cassette domain-containing protein n=1 Tax=Microbispora oryzae TaxID=2806554 RepID=A0A940WVI5_9ACTN|nr:ATP-binding cassette domain-containing protein [Microbispora oryzae]MBP2708165.1 ATP-binding cassette domain-containing protein [Microbispora oryzae]
MASIATVSDLRQGYGRRDVIRGLDLAVDAGVLGLLGPNGAGKTTLLRTLATVAPPREGLLKICGAPVRSERDARKVRRQIGYLPQDFGYFPAFTVEDFVHYCAWLRGVPKASADVAVNEAIECVNLADRRTAKLRSLSGGMLRRCGIAAAIVGFPRLILLDEPTAGLDPAQRLEFRALLRMLKRRGLAVVISTHLVEDVAAVCDTVAVMSGGRLVFHGLPDELVRAAVADAVGDTHIERGYMSVLARGGRPA